jgi:hypothetical protein
LKRLTIMLQPAAQKHYGGAMNTTPVLRAASLAALLCLAGCGSDLSRTFGFTRDAPDEFTVTTRAPLSMPPTYDLRPPRPGAVRPQELSELQQAQATLAPQAALSGPSNGSASAGQSALLSASGPAAPVDIRNRVDSDAQLDAPSRSFADRLMFWKSAPPPGTEVDPARESARLRQNAALGQPENTGDTPIIQAPKKGFLQSLF